MTHAEFDSEVRKWSTVEATANGTARTYYKDDPLNEDGSKPEGWRSGEDKAREAADGGPHGCCG